MWEGDDPGSALLVASRAARLIRTVLQGFGQRAHADALLAREIGDGARHAHRTVDGPRAHAAAVYGVGDESPPRLIRRAVLVEPCGWQERVQAAALALSRPRREHALADDRARLAQSRGL